MSESGTIALRAGAFTAATAIATIFGRVVGVQDTGTAVFWPVIGVVALGALAIRTRREYAAFVILTLVTLTSVWGLTGTAVLDSFALAMTNLACGLVIRWTSIALIPVGRRLGLVSRYMEQNEASHPARVTIGRMTTPYDVFRLVAAAFVGGSVSWGIASAILPLGADSQGLAEAGMWTIRTIANVLMVAGTGLVLLSRTREPRPGPVPHLAFSLGLTTILALIAYLVSPYLPLALLVLVPLFWSAVRCSPSMAAGHALYTVAAVGLLGAASRGMAIGGDTEMVMWSMSVHQVMIVAYMISLVVATAISEFIRLTEDLTDLAATAERSALDLRTVHETIPDALISVDRDGVATPLNPAGRHFVTAGADGQTHLMGHRDGTSPVESRESPIARALGGQTVREHRFTHVDDSGTERVFELTASPLVTEGGGTPERALLLIRDVTEHHRVLRDLAELAEIDPLTGLLNRRRFDRELTRIRESNRRDKRLGGVLTLDLDRFKTINDTFGHAMGDEVITAVAQILESVTGPSDLVARLGGDEFVILAPDADRDQLHALAVEILDRIHDFASTLEGSGRQLSASIGGATFEAATEDDTAPLLVADSALYEVKHAGRDGVLIVGHWGDREHRTRTRAEWKDRLEQALAGDELRLHLQPIVSVGADSVVGAEVLVRLDDEGTLILPAEFIPIAERAGIATSLDSWVIRESVAAAARLRELAPDFTVWINISAQSIGSAEIEDTLLACLETHRVPASAVVLELTETSRIDDVPAARSQARRLRKAGIRLAIDDFGTGFGSFVYLRHMLFDFVKIDGQFITDMDTSATDRILVRSIVGLAEQLQMQVVAENVETDSVLRLVHRERIHLAQGFGIARPCPEEVFVTQYLKQIVALH